MLVFLARLKVVRLCLRFCVLHTAMSNQAFVFDQGGIDSPLPTETQGGLNRNVGSVLGESPCDWACFRTAYSDVHLQIEKKNGSKKNSRFFIPCEILNRLLFSNPDRGTSICENRRA